MNLAELVCCPRCAAMVHVGTDEARCSSGHSFEIADGVLVMLDARSLASDPQYELQRRYFDAEFARYRRYRLENWRASYLRRLGAAGALGDGTAPVVDVGVGGSGYTVIEAARNGSYAVGCDLSLDGLIRARRFAEAEGVVERTLWICCSAERLPLASGSFSSAVAIAVMEHVPDDTAVLREMTRVLTPGGRVWVTVPHTLRHISPVLRPPNRWHDRRLGHLRRYDAKELIETARGAGLEAEDIQFTGHPVKVLQLVAGSNDRFWWWCERRDLRRSRRRRGSMQLSVVFARPT